MSWFIINCIITWHLQFICSMSICMCNVHRNRSTFVHVEKLNSITYLHIYIRHTCDVCDADKRHTFEMAVQLVIIEQIAKYTSINEHVLVVKQVKHINFWPFTSEKTILIFSIVTSCKWHIFFVILTCLRIDCWNAAGQLREDAYCVQCKFHSSFIVFYYVRLLLNDFD